MNGISYKTIKRNKTLRQFLAKEEKDEENEEPETE